MPLIEVLDLDRTKALSRVLNTYARKVHAQSGEEGVLERIFEIIPPANKVCVEFGAWDGVHLSNTRHLIMAHGWRGVLIEGDPRKHRKLLAAYEGVDRVWSRCAMVGFERGVDTLDDMLRAADAPSDPDFVCIDVDGDDWHIWRSLQDHRPRVVAIEYNPSVPHDVVFVQDRASGLRQGASLAAMVKLGRDMGYELACVMKPNAIFILADLFPRLGIADNSLDAMTPNAPGRVWQGYDCVIYNSLGTLGWTGRGARVAPDALRLVAPPEDDA